jgi:hypothetical protein
MVPVVPAASHKMAPPQNLHLTTACLMLAVLVCRRFELSGQGVGLWPLAVQASSHTRCWVFKDSGELSREFPPSQRQLTLVNARLPYKKTNLLRKAVKTL